jgi:hypothetical protein
MIRAEARIGGTNVTSSATQRRCRQSRRSAAKPAIESVRSLSGWIWW